MDLGFLMNFFFAGMGAPLVGVAPIFALSFFGNDLGKTLIRGATGSSELNAFQLGLAGGFSGILTTAIMAPGERIKCILQVRKLRIPTFRVPEFLYEFSPNSEIFLTFHFFVK